MVNRLPAPPMPIDGFPDGALDRLKQLDQAFSRMGTKEMAAALVWLRSKYRAEWPGDLS